MTGILGLDLCTREQTNNQDPKLISGILRLVFNYLGSSVVDFKTGLLWWDFLVVKDRENTAKYGFPFSDLTRQESEVREGVNKTLAELVAWSLRCAAEGRYPDRGFYGEEFPKNTYRSSRCGKPIADGHKLLAKRQFPFQFYFCTFRSMLLPNQF